MSCRHTIPALHAVTTIRTGKNWLFEMKFYGYRAQVGISRREFRICSRNGQDWTEQSKVILPPLSIS